MAGPDRLDFARRYVDTLGTVLRALPLDGIAATLEILERAHAARKRVLVVGNGGSAATASHMANDLVWGLAHVGKLGLRASSLSDNVPVVTAIANDRGYQDVFAVQIETHADPGDVLIAVSGSGNSANVLRAVDAAKAKGMTTIGFLGMEGGKLRRMVDVAVVVPSNDYGPIEDVHMMLDHLITAYLRDRIAGPG